MDKDIYELLNEVDTDLDEYEKQDLSQFEQKKMFKNFKKKIDLNPKSKLPTQKLVAAAAVGILTFGSLGATTAMATSNPTLYKIADFLGINKDLEPYENVVGKSVTKRGVTMTVNEVIVDNDRVVVSVVTSGDVEAMENFEGTGGMLYVNGKRINKGSIASHEVVDDFTGHSIVIFPVEEQLADELDIRLELFWPLDSDTVSQIPKFIYEFKVSGEALAGDTKVYPLDKQVQTETGASITLEKYIANPFSDRVYFEVDNNMDESENYSIQGVDQDGNWVKYNWRMMRFGKSEFLPSGEYMGLIQDATELTLSLYVNDQPVGEEFVIKK